MASEKKKRIGNLTTVSDVIRETKRIYREARNNEISPENMVRFGQVLHKITQMMETNELEQRIQALEKQANVTTRK